jgi:hypothetical protein
MFKKNIQLGIPSGKYLRFEATMKGSIHSDQVCQICGSKFKSSELKRGLFCPHHPKSKPNTFDVRYGRKIHRRFNNYEAALQFLTGLRYQDGSGNFDARDYQVKTKPLAFDTLAGQWLAAKKPQLKPGGWQSLKAIMGHAIAAWAGMNIKAVQYIRWRHS